ncbi:hypothetical protein B0H63DRAFT_519449 [Podospora didyma]|uniref:Prp 4 CRoW domain-containing protein n=1 Tax=Podospora didyma TaxID=330526 RepID=A0AAE0U474_9PEZI|nr:hypothetical protein B0H63DRAFT_519449 [Podospora didyma]
MLAKSITALAALAFALHAAAEPMPYKPQVMKMSVRQLFGVVRREDVPGYQPEQAVCGTGATCADACGAGFTTCESGDSQVHCFNPAAAQTCCPDNTGNSCDAGYFCAADTVGETWCCPNGMSLTACAAAYSVSGGLVSETAKPTTSSTRVSSVVSTSAPVTTTSSVISFDKNSTTTAFSSGTAAGTGGLVPTASVTGSNITSTVRSIISSPTPTQSKVADNAGSVLAPAGALILLAAGIAALL